MAVIKKSMAAGAGGRVAGSLSRDGNDLYDILVSIVSDLDNIKSIFDGHKHSFDGSQAASSISNTPVTGTTSGTAAGGTATNWTTGTTVES